MFVSAQLSSNQLTYGLKNINIVSNDNFLKIHNQLRPLLQDITSNEHLVYGVFDVVKIFLWWCVCFQIHILCNSYIYLFWLNYVLVFVFFFFVMNTYKGWRFCYSLIPKISNTLWGTAILTVVLTSTGWVFFFQLRSYQIVVVGVNHCVLHFYIYIFVVSQYRPCQRQNVAVFVLK